MTTIFFPQNDRIDDSRKSEIGTIKIVRKKGQFVKEEYRPIQDINFYQANKKDAHSVTHGHYTMSTTKKGRYLNRTRPYDVKLKKLWKMDEEVGSITLHYRMGHTLEDMGLKLKDIDWNKTHSQRTSSLGSESSESPEDSSSLKSMKEQPSDEHDEVIPTTSTTIEHIH